MRTHMDSKIIVMLNNPSRWSDVEGVCAYVVDPMFANTLKAFKEDIITIGELRDSPGVRVIPIDRLISFYLSWEDLNKEPYRDYNIAYSDDITEEFEKVLFDMKETGDLSTEEVVKAVKSRSIKEGLK